MESFSGRPEGARRGGTDDEAVAGARAGEDEGGGAVW